MLRAGFIWLTNPVKQSLLRKASLAFRINQHLEEIAEEEHILNFIDPAAKRVFSSTIPNAQVLKF